MVSRISEEFGITRDLLALSFARLADAFGNGLLIIAIPLYLASFENSIGVPSELLTGVVLASYGFASSVFQPFFGRASDKLGKRKPFLVYGLIAVALASFSFSYAHSFESLLVANAVRGVSVAITVPPAMALVADITRKRTRGGSMGVYTTMRMTGFAAAPLFAGVFIETISYEAVFFLGGSVALLGALLVHVLISEPKTNSNPSSPKVQKSNPKVPRDFYVLGLSMFLMMTSTSLMVTLETQFNQMLNQTAIGFGIAFSPS